jgi:replicative DNA helicase
MRLARAAERAVIGALLLEPARLADVHEWLRPDDFDGGAERQTYQAICHVTDRGEPLTPDLVDRQLREGKADGPVLADGAFLIGTMDACPAPSRASVYGRMVLELSIRRHIAADIAGLRHKAEQASTSEQLNTVFAQIDGVQLGVKNLHLREALAAHTASVAPNWAGELKPLSRFPRYGERVVERQAVVALVDQPTALKTVARWLKPNDFSDDECAGLFSELTVLREANNPIDGITGRMARPPGRDQWTGLRIPGISTRPRRHGHGPSPRLASGARAVGEGSGHCHCRGARERDLRR